MIILKDTREQHPYSFEKFPVTVKSSSSGDYSIQGFEDKAAIERKSLDDLIGCLSGKNRIRFEKELSRARHYELFAVVVESDIAAIAAKKYFSVMNPESVLKSVFAFHVRYRIPFLFAVETGQLSAAEAAGILIGQLAGTLSING